MRTRLLSYESGGHKIRMECYEARGLPRRACILLLHGAEGLAVNRTWLNHQADALTGLGYAVYLPHYFDRSGHSVVVDREIIRTHFHSWLDTTQDGLRYALRDASTERGGVVGISLGGFLTTALAARDAHVRAAVELCGGSLAHLPNTASATQARAGLKPSRPGIAVQPAEASKQAGRRGEPSPYYVDLYRMPPLLLVHGALDPEVPVQAAYLLSAALQGAGRYHELAIYASQRHGFDVPAAVHVTRRTASFLQRWIP